MIHKDDHIVVAKKQRKEKGSSILCPFQGHALNDLLPPTGPHFLKFHHFQITPEAFNTFGGHLNQTMKNAKLPVMCLAEEAALFAPVKSYDSNIKWQFECDLIGGPESEPSSQQLLNFWLMESGRQ